MARAQISQNNLFGRGQSLSFQATISSIRSMANLRFADNYLFDTNIRFAANIYRLQTVRPSYARRSVAILPLGIRLMMIECFDDYTLKRLASNQVASVRRSWSHQRFIRERHHKQSPFGRCL